MKVDRHHEDLIKGFYKQFEEIFKNSGQAIYLYLDDVHKICNKKFSTLLGYSSPSEWAALEGPFPSVLVAEESQEAIVRAYQNAIKNFTASSQKIVWKKKNGRAVSTTVILVPVLYKGHRMALHFVND